MRPLYLLVDLGSIVIPLLFSFYPKAPFYKTWKHLWVSMLITALGFIAWDEWFTSMGTWGFNKEYLIGIYVGSLPIEEILFFLCIPYACVFTYEALNYLIKENWFEKIQKYISLFLIVVLGAVGVVNYDKIYTVTTFIATSAILFFITFVWKPHFMGRFYQAFIVILIPFFIVNGILTGSWIKNEVVWYNNSENLGVRIGTIPVEDFSFGLLLILVNICLFEVKKLKETSVTSEKPKRTRTIALKQQ